MTNGFYFAGRSTQEFGMLVERCPTQSAPARKRTIVTIPGRNGDLHYDEGAYENYTQSYECGFRGERSTPEQAHNVKAWLLSAGANQRLVDAHDPDHFRLATFVGPMDIENRLNKIGKCTIKFDCDPRSFLKSGESSQLFTAAGTLPNPTAFAAKPLITIYGASAGTVTVGGVTVEIKSITDQITLDCETMNAYRSVGGAITNANSNIYAPEFPELVPGDNAIRWTGGITQIEITPRWWTL